MTWNRPTLSPRSCVERGSIEAAAWWEENFGFTNQSIWPELGLSEPIWAPIYDSTVQFQDGETAQHSLVGAVGPRIEVEVVVKLAALAPVAIEWAALGYEIVQCHFPDWEFNCADAVADFGLHRGLLVGEPSSDVDQEWIGRQSWCDGTIGMFGTSYPGFTQLLPAPQRSEYVKAIVPVAAQSDNSGRPRLRDGASYRRPRGHGRHRAASFLRDERSRHRFLCDGRCWFTLWSRGP